MNPATSRNAHNSLGSENMRRLIAIALLSVLTIALASARQTRTEITSPASSADTTQNSSVVPDVYPISGQFERIVVLRFKYQTDLLRGLEEMTDKEEIRNAVILAGTGSARSYHFHAISNRTFPTKNIFVKDTLASVDIVSMNGYVIDGRVHAHITFADADKAFGGHLESGTRVFTFAIVTLGVLNDGTDLRRIDDKTYR